MNNLKLSSTNSWLWIACCLACSLFISASAYACTDEFKPVCGYWMHNSKTQTFANECKMREAGAKNRHAGSCADQKPANTPSKPNAK
jgi:hypothetical protein